MAVRHNSRLCVPDLSLSEVGARPDPDDCTYCDGSGCTNCRPRPVGAGGRLTHTVARYLANPRRRRYPAELIAARIRRDGGDVWGAVLDYGISYAHASRIRRGWRPGRRTAERIERAA